MPELGRLLHDALCSVRCLSHGRVPSPLQASRVCAKYLLLLTAAVGLGRSLHDALCVVRCLVHRKFLIPGGAAPEVELSMQLAKTAKTLQVCFTILPAMIEPYQVSGSEAHSVQLRN